MGICRVYAVDWVVLDVERSGGGVGWGKASLSHNTSSICLVSKAELCDEIPYVRNPYDRVSVQNDGSSISQE